MTRLRAARIHLILSVAVALVCAALVFLVWYPNPLQIAVGVTSIFLIVLAVDVTIGPLLTLVVFNPKKKSLRFDLAVIALLQIAALIYGLHTVFVGRPVYAVFNTDRFDLVRLGDLDVKSLASAKPDYASLPVLGPKWVAALPPTDVKRRNDVLFSAAGGGADLPQMPEFYAPLDSVRADIKARAQPLAELKKFNAAALEAVAALEQRYAAQPVGFLPLKASAKDMTVIVNTQTGEILDTVNLRPWS